MLTLGYSRKAMRLLVWQSSTQIWAELHVRAFRRLGGTVRVIVLDNLKEGVLTPDIYDPAVNPLCSAHAPQIRCDFGHALLCRDIPGDTGRGMAIGAADPTTLTEHSADVAGHVVAHVGIVG